MKEATIEVLGKEDVINLIDKQWMLVTAGTAEKFNTMTASWGAIGNLWNRPVAIIFIRPERYTHELIETGSRISLSFFNEDYRAALKICGSKSGRDCDKVSEAGLTALQLESGTMGFEQARLTLDCRQLFRTEMKEADFLDPSLLKWYGEKGGLHTVYVLEIEKVYEG